MKPFKKNQRLFDKNKKILLKYFPNLDWAIEKDIPAHVDVFRYDDGVDVRFGDNRFYGVDANFYAQKNIDTFLASPPGIELDSAGVPDGQLAPMHLALHRKFDKIFREKEMLASYEKHKRSGGATFYIFGLGLGLHIEDLIAHSQCRSIVIFEPEPVFLKLSMYFIDWKKILRLVNYKLAIVMESTPEQAFASARWFGHSRNIGVQQLISYSQHYHSPYLDSIYSYFKKNAINFIDGLGYYDDEKIMLKNHLLNSYMSVWRAIVPMGKAIPGTAVVVGAGPSLDQDIAWIKENYDNLIIFSGGSALPTLLHNGIIPDFHVEIENIAMNYQLLQPLVEKYDLTNTILICSSTMDPKAAHLFKRRLWYFREGVMASALYDCGIETLRWQNPTVVNSALSAALHAGFREIILLGSDFGTKDPQVHHSKNTFYEYHEEFKDAQFKFPEVTKANFGGEAYTNAHYLNGINYLRVLIGQHKNVSVYNGSDGAAIPKTIPLRVSRYKFKSLYRDKREVVDLIYGASTEIDWRVSEGPDMLDNLQSEFDRYIDSLLSIFKMNSSKERDIFYFMMNSYERMSTIDPKLMTFNPMINGTINYITMLVIFWWRRVEDQFLDAYVQVGRSFLRQVAREIRRDFRGFLIALRQELPLVRPDLFDDKGTLIVEAKLGVQNAE